jgi:hypothetical protein
VIDHVFADPIFGRFTSDTATARRDHAMNTRYHQAQWLVLVGLLAFASGCVNVEGKEQNPLENRMEYTASGATVAGCQENLDKMAGAHVQMTMHAGSFLNYGCKGYADIPPPSGTAPK